MSSDYSPKLPSPAPLAEGLSARSFSPGLEEGGADAASASFTRAVEHNFYEPWLSAEQLNREVELQVSDRQRFYGVYYDPGFAALEPWGEVQEAVGFASEHPVGTFVDFDRTLNAGGAEPLSARLITGVTVSPSFRRRGILRHMMTDCLQRAVQDRVPVAALTASEGGIYGRYGFGPATREAKVEVDLGESAPDQLSLRGSGEGKVLMVDPTRLETTAKDVFAGYHAQTRGSVGRQEQYWRVRTARWNPAERGGWNRKLRAAVHVLPDGAVGGYVTYTHQGWDTEPSTVAIGDLIVQNETSRLELWRYLAGLDTVRRATLVAPVEDPTPHGLTNARAWRINRVQEMLWVRILNPVEALEARAWNADGEFSLTISDPLGIADGTFTVAVSAGVAQVIRTAGPTAPQHFALDAETLGSVYLGDTSVLTMRDAGRINAKDEADWSAFAATFDLPTTPHCATHF